MKSLLFPFLLSEQLCPAIFKKDNRVWAENRSDDVTSWILITILEYPDGMAIAVDSCV